ncbi:MAG: hypothetical protein Q7S58_12765 [Candidatus Binatus sp.]|uniref:hypothetical protein n=1 Tax=Candidatus Binatus sp. TaxID=2811406 RepID=UPI00272057DA|nr:hypothetical protein [Candidatus Binatus sp.]MDO8433272.1 hypothetical protein [Candidatus Binatus sp.]
MLSRERRVHQGMGFDLWTGQRSWFWKLADRGAIGAALSHPQAVREACRAIDELLECDSGFDPAGATSAYHERWHSALDRLARYVAAA